MRTVLVAAVMLMGCATGYHSDGYSGGHRDVRVNNDTWIVSFAGNGFTPGSQVRDMLLIRACEVTLANGCRKFVVLKSDGDVSTSYVKNGNVVHSINKPSMSAIIKCSNGTEDETLTTVYDAELLARELAPRYGVAIKVPVTAAPPPAAGPSAYVPRE